MSTSQRVDTIPYFGKFDCRRAFAFGAAPGAVMITMAIGIATDPEASRAMSAYMPRVAQQSNVQIAATDDHSEAVIEQVPDNIRR